MVSGGGHGAKFTATDHTPLNVGKNVQIDETVVSQVGAYGGTPPHRRLT